MVTAVGLHDRWAPTDGHHSRNVYVGLEPTVGLCDADPCGETYTLSSAPDLSSEDSWRDKGSLTNEDIVAVGASSVLLVFGLTGRYKQAKY